MAQTARKPAYLARLRPRSSTAALLLAGTFLLGVPHLHAQDVPPGETDQQDPYGGASQTALAAAAAFSVDDPEDETDTDRSATNAAGAVDPRNPQTGRQVTDAEAAAAAAAEDTLQPEAESFRIVEETNRENLAETSVDGLRVGEIEGRDAAPGLRLGTFVLKPSINQGIAYETTKTGSASESRGFSTTTLKGSLTSDWSRHQLTVEGEGTFERNLWGQGATDPEFDIDADLRLDLAGQTTANITAGYSFERESSTDPNAISNADVQSGVHQMSLGAAVQRDFGLIRGTLGTTLVREVYGDAELANGGSLSLADRDNTEGTVTARVGYELSPALIPFIEASVGRSIYDQLRDSLGYERSAYIYGGRTGVEVDMGEKLRGELGIGYKRATFDDDRLKALDAFTIDGSANWSPRRGTDVTLGLTTALEPSTTAGESGYVSYGTTAEVTHELRDNLVAKLNAAYTLRDFSSTGGVNQNVYLVGGGLTWDINRWLALTSDLSYEVTTQRGSADTAITRAGLGLTVRR